MRCRRVSFVFAAIFGIFNWGIEESLEWSDRGHLIIAEIAKLSISKKALDRIEYQLHQWDKDFPGIGSLETASIWLDHIGCSYSTVHCGGFATLDNIQIFRTWHYTTNILNPQQYDIPGVYKYLPFPDTGSAWVLKTVFESLMKTGAIPKDKLASPSSALQTTDQLSPPLVTGSVFSHNMQLRLLLHIFGDIHQPLHNASLFSKDFPQGDQGGNLILIDVPWRTENLHFLWDDGCLTTSLPFYQIPLEIILKEANEIRAAYPPESLKDRLSGDLRGDNFHAIVQESAGLVPKIVYSEFDWATFSASSLPYTPSQEYINTCRGVAQQQMALAGYRLAYILELIGALLPDPVVPGEEASGNCPKLSESGGGVRT